MEIGLSFSQMKGGEFFPTLWVGAGEGGNGREGTGEEEEADCLDEPGMGVRDGELHTANAVGGTKGEEEGIFGGALEAFEAVKGGETVFDSRG